MYCSHYQLSCFLSSMYQNGEKHMLKNWVDLFSHLVSMNIFKKKFSSVRVFLSHRGIDKILIPQKLLWMSSGLYISWMCFAIIQRMREDWEAQLWGGLTFFYDLGLLNCIQKYFLSIWAREGALIQNEIVFLYSQTIFPEQFSLEYFWNDLFLAALGLGCGSLGLCWGPRASGCGTSALWQPQQVGP